MTAVSTSKVVCLRAFNEDLATKPWQSQPVPPPPPMPKRIAWPGGKIVSNKDEALASFLKRKLDGGQALTSEQMAMLAKMTDVKSHGATTTNSKRKVCGSGSKSTFAVKMEARSLLKKLEQKVAQGSVKEDSKYAGFITASKARSRTVNLSSLKGDDGNDQNPSAQVGTSMAKYNRRLAKAQRKAMAATAALSSFPAASVSSASTMLEATPVRTSGRRVVSDGRGGFSIASSALASVATTTAAANRNPVSTNTTFSVTLTQSASDDATTTANEELIGSAGIVRHKRARVAFNASSSGNRGRGGAAMAAGDQVCGVDTGDIRTTAKSVPNVMTKAEVANGGGRVWGCRGKGFTSGRGKGAKMSKGTGGGIVGGGGKGGTGERSLEDLLSAGLASSRR